MKKFLIVVDAAGSEFILGEDQKWHRRSECKAPMDINTCDVVMADDLPSWSVTSYFDESFDYARSNELQAERPTAQAEASEI